MMSKLETAIFACGCFWGVEDYFSKVKGVKETKVGYTGGHTKSPTYEDICSDETGHAEAIEVKFDSKMVSFEELTRKFFAIHDPTQVNRQGPDVGSQYRSAVFYLNKEQKETAEKVKKEIEQKIGKKVATEITNASTFYPAEEYHQQYFKKRGGGTCHVLKF